MASSQQDDVDMSTDGIEMDNEMDNEHLIEDEDNLIEEDIQDPTKPTLSRLLTSLRRRTFTLHNRLASISSDAAFVAAVSRAYPTRPLVANERCGSWYVPPPKKAGSAYFKSTDGHEGVWGFSTRRLNLQLVGMVEENDGIIIVDSTRRGKRMPDALSKTIPIWCTVLNLALLPSHPLSSKLFLPHYLPPSTHAQITSLIPSFLASLTALKLTLPRALTKPLRPYWITQDSALPDPDDGDASGVIFEEYRPVICCTASRRVTGSEVDQAGYIQGAGDDTENWAQGLTPAIFWAHADALLSALEADLPGLITSLVEQEQQQDKGDNAADERVRLTPWISVCPLRSVNAPNERDADECLILLTQATTPKESWIQSPTRIQVGLGKHKSASRNLRTALPEIAHFARSYLQKPSPPADNTLSDGTADATSSSIDTAKKSGQIVVACDSGRDISVGVALALLCYLFDEAGTQFCESEQDMLFSKAQIKVRLGAIMTAYPEANPSRATLQSVNSFLMDWR